MAGRRTWKHVSLEQLKELMARKKWSMAVLARKVGVSRSAASRWLLGKNPPNYKTQLRLKDIIDGKCWGKRKPKLQESFPGLEVMKHLVGSLDWRRPDLVVKILRLVIEYIEEGGVE